MIIAWLIGNPFSETLLKDYTKKHNNSGGWVYTQLFALADIKKIAKLVVISVHSSYKNDFTFSYGKFEVYCIKDKPLKWKYDSNTSRKIDAIINDTHPDIIDVQGIEITIDSYSIYNQVNIPIINTIHGIAFQCKRAYCEGVPKMSLVLDRTLKDNMTLHGIIEQAVFMHKRAKEERKILTKINYIRGRTCWDEFCVKSINPELKYYHVELILRQPFYNNIWDIQKCNQHQIFVPQCHIPYKGFYNFIIALEIIKKYIGNVIVHVPGQAFRSGINRNGYEKLIQREIKKRHLQNNIFFLGTLNAEQMVDELKNCRVFVLPSVVENSPNSLAEAQIIGVPCVSSLVGGTSDYIQDGVNGYLYNSADPYMCAERVIRLFKDDKLSVQFSVQARAAALRRHDPPKCTEDLVNVYENILSSGVKYE